MSRQRLEPTLNVQGWVDIRLVAGALQEIAAERPEDMPESWSSVVRWAFKRAARETPISVAAALDIISTYGFSLPQLERRGTEIRKAIQAEEQASRSDTITDRAAQIEQELGG